jgi:hypothetical protein
MHLLTLSILFYFNLEKKEENNMISCISIIPNFFTNQKCLGGFEKMMRN